MLENQISSHSGKKLIILGFATIATIFIMYTRYQNSELITPDSIDTIQRIAYGFYIILLTAFGAIGYGMYRYHK